MTKSAPLVWMGYAPASSVACAIKNDTKISGEDVASTLLHSFLNAALIGTVAYVAGAEPKRAAYIGAGGSFALYLGLLTAGYFDESCQKIVTTTTTIITTPKEIKVGHQIQFDFDKATIKPISYPILDDVAGILLAHPSWTIEIQGHTDDVGGAVYNKKLSQERAESVRQYFIKKGVAPTRMTAVGYGLEAPIASNATEEGRAQNRRVQFMRTDADVKTSGLVSPEF